MLERIGIATAALITEPFVGSAKAMGASQGAPNFPWVTVPHPIATQTDDVLAQWAKAALPEVVSLLLDGNGGKGCRIRIERKPRNNTGLSS